MEDMAVTCFTSDAFELFIKYEGSWIKIYADKFVVMLRETGIEQTWYWLEYFKMYCHDWNNAFIANPTPINDIPL